MKKLLLVYTVFVYSVPVAFFGAIFMLSSREEGGSSTLLPFIVPVILMFAVCALAAANTVGAVISAMRSKQVSLRDVMLFKLCLIPFYIINFICWGLASVVFNIALFAWPMIPFVVIYTYVTILGTSAHSVAKLLTLYRDKRISAKQCMIHCTLQLIFAADMIDSVYLAVKEKNSDL